MVKPAISAGGRHSGAVLANGIASCWGDNTSGELGNGTTSNSSTPVVVSGFTNAVAISASDSTESGSHSCALLANGTAKCWGFNESGQLGDGTTTGSQTCYGDAYCRTTPAPVKDLSNAVAIAAGTSHSCALLANGTAKCWGDNNIGQLGDGTTTGPDTCFGGPGCSATPVPVKDLSNAVAIAAGADHSCALLANGTAKCWGDNFSGQLGNGSTLTKSSTPVAVSGLTNAVAIAAGNSDSCALLANGWVKCWGYNGYGDLGNGTTTNSSTPVVVSVVTTAVAITGSGLHSCAVLANGTAKCWGTNTDGELGNGTSGGISSTAVVVSGMTTAVAISAGVNHSCALLGDGTAKCWGNNPDGELGNGTTTNSSTPVGVSGLSSDSKAARPRSTRHAVSSERVATAQFARFRAVTHGSIRRATQCVSVRGSAGWCRGVEFG